ncbi:unnamed protein product [Onchocerca ochengi]|uniref:Uncharacterized protein n=1 Tax=Onchocerca ochengi TaxID=42157 RepID=A0A182ECS2_ONCOC|nr:unnamed protein product [Onchocerca ochengi]
MEESIYRRSPPTKRTPTSHNRIHRPPSSPPTWHTNERYYANGRMVDMNGRCKRLVLSVVGAGEGGEEGCCACHVSAYDSALDWLATTATATIARWWWRRLLRLLLQLLLQPPSVSKDDWSVFRNLVAFYFPESG